MDGNLSSDESGRKIIVIFALSRSRFLPDDDYWDVSSHRSRLTHRDDEDDVLDDGRKEDDCCPFQWHYHHPYHYHYRSDRDVSIPSC